MKKLYAFILGLFLFSVSARAENPAITFVNTLADNVINNILTADVSQEEKMQRFKTAHTSHVIALAGRSPRWVSWGQK